MNVADCLYAVFGASGCGRGIMPLLRIELAKQRIPAESVVFVDDNANFTAVNGHKVLDWKTFLAHPAADKKIAIAIANSQVRETLFNRCSDAKIASLSVTAENVIQMDGVVVGEGALLSPNVVLTSNIRIGKAFHANLYSYVEHDCVIGDFVTFAPRVMCNGNVHIEDHAYIGAGAMIKQGTPAKPLIIGRGATVGMGAVVTRSVPPNVTVVGNPARIIER